MSFARRLAGVALGLPFVLLGYDAVREPGGRVDAAASLGLPEPELAVRANGAAMIAGGLGVATGVLRGPAAVGLIASLVPTTVAGHPFWSEQDAAVRAQHRIQVLKNVGLAGGLLALVVAGRAERR